MKNIYKWFYLHDRKLREIFKSMDVNDSGTVKLGEVCTFYQHQVSWKNSSKLMRSSSFPGLGDVTVEHNVQ